ncbi:MAG: hypothetical protein Q9221_004652 [Calogaya cf. arnoldii]
MHYARYFLFLTLSPLLTLAQTSPVTAIRQATTEYKEILARLVGVRSDCERTLINPLSCDSVFGRVVTDITQANDQLDIAAQNFVPKVPCATIAAVFSNLQGNITSINERLRNIACSSSLATQAAAKANAVGFRRALTDQLVAVDSIGTIFARNTACNNPQRPAALSNFANAVAAIDADDKKTAQAFSLLGGTVGCLI